MTSSKKTTQVAIAVIAGVLVLGAVIYGLMSLFGSDDQGGAGSSNETTAIPQPNETTASVATEKPTKLAPAAALTETREISDGGEVRISSIESVTSQAQIPGEVVGPALRVSVRIEAGDEAIDLSRVVVNAYYGKDLTPAIEASGPGVKPVSGTLKPGKNVTGVFVFNVPAEERGSVTVEFIHGGSVKPLKFQGSVS